MPIADQRGQREHSAGPASPSAGPSRIAPAQRQAPIRAEASNDPGQRGGGTGRRVCAASPIARDPRQSCQTMTQPATVVARAAAMKPMTGIRPTAKARVDHHRHHGIAERAARILARVEQRLQHLVQHEGGQAQRHRPPAPARCWPSSSAPKAPRWNRTGDQRQRDDHQRHGGGHGQQPARIRRPG